VRRAFFRADALAGLALLALHLALALGAPLLFPGDPLDSRGRPLLPPFTAWELPLGTDRAGRDLLAGIAHGAGVSGAIALVSAAAAIALGALIGAVAGSARGLADDALMRLTDLFQTIPAFLLALALVAVLGPSTQSVIVAIALVSWTGTARIVRAEVMSLQTRPFVMAARALGLGPTRILLRHVAPHLAAPVLVLGTQVASASLLIEAALSFLGLGDPNAITWGGMIAAGRPVFRVAPWVSAIPGIAIALSVLGIVLVGEALTAAFDPRRR
jgi:peptide/nickel transport system permease protein